jgi:hypothetical protein
MNTTVTQDAAVTRESAEPVKLLKRIGSTVYIVNIHFSETSKETLGDKIVRLIEREAAGL